MYRSIADFVADWQGEVASTEKVLAALTDASLAQAVTPEGRTLGRLAWHLVHTLTEMPKAAGLLDADELEHAPVPASADAIRAAYHRLARQVPVIVSTKWTDAQLDEELPMYGEQWSKRTVLAVLLRHEIHHRGQLTVLLRQSGLRVPGVYGPAREDWAEYGLPTPA